MMPLPNPSVALFDQDGTGNRFLTAVLGNTPGTNPILVDNNGCATPIFRQFLAGLAATPLPSATTPLADDAGRPTPVFTKLLMGLP